MIFIIPHLSQLVICHWSDSLVSLIEAEKSDNITKKKNTEHIYRESLNWNGVISADPNIENVKLFHVFLGKNIQSDKTIYE